MSYSFGVENFHLRAVDIFWLNKSNKCTREFQAEHIDLVGILDKLETHQYSS